MNVPPLRPRPIPPRPHWTEPVSREETLARREKFQKIDWLPPNHKPKTKKGTAAAKWLWDKYVIRGCHLCLQRGVSVRTANGMLSGIVSILVSMPIRTFWKANITTLNPGLIGSTVQPRRRTIVLVIDSIPLGSTGEDLFSTEKETSVHQSEEGSNFVNGLASNESLDRLGREHGFVIKNPGQQGD
jgi:hypothetical protein